MKLSKLMASGMAAGIIAAAAGMAGNVMAANLGDFVVGSTVELYYLCPLATSDNTMDVTNDSAVVVFHEFAMDDDASAPNGYSLNTSRVDFLGGIGSYIAVVTCTAGGTFEFEFTLVAAPPPTTTTTTTTTMTTAAPATTTALAPTTTAAAVLPATGGANDTQMAVFASCAVLSGAALLLVRRRVT